jgi:hypothetical protein
VSMKKGKICDLVVGILCSLLISCTTQSAAYTLNYDVLISSQYEQDVAKFSPTGELLRVDI